jgi:D-alanyl-D-alanine carboxypeptidase
VQGWAAGFAAAALALAAGGWFVSTWDELDVVDVAQASPPTTDGLTGVTSSTTSTTSTTPTSTPTTTAADPNATTTTTIPQCTVAEGQVEGDPVDDWSRIVVDTSRTLPANYVPPDLVEVAVAGFNTGESDKVRQVAVADLDALRRGAARNGAPIVLVSAYRSYQRQAELFADQVAEDGEGDASHTTARPGHSEHQLGTTIDVLDPASGDLTEAFSRTDAGRWLAANSYRYGWVLSYPDGGTDRTCYDYEPWHLRYVGRETATLIHESGLTPREWMLSHPT